MTTAADIKVEESRDVAFFDQVMNAPGVYEGVADDACAPRGEMRMQPLLIAGNIFLKVLAGETPIGFFLLVRKGAGLYETHTLILPEFRRWALRATHVGKAWMFCTTDAVTLSTYAWAHARNVRWLIHASGMKEEATRTHQHTIAGKPVDKIIYSLSLPEWVRTACGDYREDGRKFHDQVPNATQDANRDAMTGLLLTMALQGQPEKAQSLFNRWAQLHDFNQIFVIGRRGTALVLDIGAALVAVKPDLETLVLERRKL